MGGAPSSFPITSHQNEWVDKNSKKAGITLYARNLRIDLSDDKDFWLWRGEDDQQAVSKKSILDVAELLDSYWLEVQGTLEVAKLSPGTSYELLFNVMLKDSAYGWEAPVDVRLTLPDGKMVQHKVNLMEKERGKWIEIPVGSFTTEKTRAGEIKLSIYKYGGAWKSGLVIKSITIQPKK